MTTTTNGVDVDPEALRLDALLTAWTTVFSSQALLVGDLIDYAETGIKPGEKPEINMDDVWMPDASTPPDPSRSTPRDPRTVFIAALCEFCPPRPQAKLPSSAALGNRLKVAKSRVVGGRRLMSVFDPHRKQQLWRVESVVATDAGVAGVAGIGGSQYPQETTQRNHDGAGIAGIAGIDSSTRGEIQNPREPQQVDEVISPSVVSSGEGAQNNTRVYPQYPQTPEITVQDLAGVPVGGETATPATPAASALVAEIVPLASAPRSVASSKKRDVTVTDTELAALVDAFEAMSPEDRALAEHQARGAEIDRRSKYPPLEVTPEMADILDMV